MKSRFVRLSLAVLATLSFAAVASGQALPPECSGMPEASLVDLSIVPASFKDRTSNGPGYDKWTVRGQFFVQASTGIDLGPEADQQQITLILTQSAEDPQDETEIFSHTLEPQDFKTLGRRGAKWRHAVKKAAAGPDDEWRIASLVGTLSPGNPPIPPGSLNRYKFRLVGFPNVPLDLLDQDEAVPLRITMKIEPTQTTCAEDESLCVCATYPLACAVRGGGRTIRCFSSPGA